MKHNYVRKNFDPSVNQRSPDAWQTLCGVRGAHTKYLETFKVRGNKHLAVAIIRQQGKQKDMSYLRNAREVSRVCANMY